MPGAVGLTLHTILADGMGGVWVGISAAGVFASRDGGRTWEMRNRRGNRAGPAGALPRDWGDGVEFRHEDEIFTCVHNLAFGAAAGLIYMQNHQGVYRSRDGGAIWEEITEGLPSTFGFPVAAHPRDPGVAWVFPLNGTATGAGRRKIGRWSGRPWMVARTGRPRGRGSGAGLLFHCAAAGDGGGPGQPLFGGLRDQFGVCLPVGGRGRELGGSGTAPADGAVGRVHAMMWRGWQRFGK